MLRIIVAGTATVLLLTGCAHTGLRGHAGQYERTFRDEVGVWGNANEVTLLRGSEVSKLSILGDANRVTIENGATIRKLEIAGRDNVVQYPDGERFEYNYLGIHNRLIRKPVPAPPPLSPIEDIPAEPPPPPVETGDPHS